MQAICTQSFLGQGGRLFFASTLLRETGFCWHCLVNKQKNISLVPGSICCLLILIETTLQSPNNDVPLDHTAAALLPSLTSFVLWDNGRDQERLFSVYSLQKSILIYPQRVWVGSRGPGAALWGSALWLGIASLWHRKAEPHPSTQGGTPPALGTPPIYVCLLHGVRKIWKESWGGCHELEDQQSRERWAGKETCTSLSPASTVTARWQTVPWHSLALPWQPISKVQTAKCCVIRGLA